MSRYENEEQCAIVEHETLSRSGKGKKGIYERCDFTNVIFYREMMDANM